MLKGIQYYILFIGIVAMFFTGCGINSEIMFKVPKGEEVSLDSIPLEPKDNYRVSVDDKLTFKLYTNDGEQLINATISENGRLNQGKDVEYVVRKSGMVELPKIGSVKVAGLSIVEVEDVLEGLYSKDYNNPYVQARVTNQRVVVFPGSGGDAKVIPLANNNTTLVEVLASAGGISERGRAKAVKLMRRVEDKREVYVMDLSTIEGLKYADMVVQANDYIYVEPNPEIARGVLKEVAPIVSIISSALVVFTVFNAIK